MQIEAFALEHPLQQVGAQKTAPKNGAPFYRANTPANWNQTALFSLSPGKNV